MTGPEGNSEFCFPRISQFPKGPVIKWQNKSKLRFQRQHQATSDHM